MSQARRHDRDGDSSIEHLGRHEVTEIVEPELAEAGNSPHLDESIGHEVRRPRPGARFVGTEDEAILGSHPSPARRYGLVVTSQELEARCVECDPI